MFQRIATLICLLSSVNCQLTTVNRLVSFTSVENPLQISLFLQNKPNFADALMNVSSYKTMNYEQITMNNANKNKPNTNPIKPNIKPIKANKMPKQTQSNPISKRSKNG
jgi:hypothetical protein